MQYNVKKITEATAVLWSSKPDIFSMSSAFASLFKLIIEMFVPHLGDGQCISLGVHSSGCSSYPLNQLHKDKVNLNLMLSIDYSEEEGCMWISNLKWPAVQLGDEL